jgi:uncharacterized protein YndB with AHSA1/START domain
MPTAADSATLWAALTVPERVAAWFATASPLGAVGALYTLDFGDGSIVDGELRELVRGHRFAYRLEGGPGSRGAASRWPCGPT